MTERNKKKNLLKGELKCDFITHNLDEVTDFWRSKRLGIDLDPSTPIPIFHFSTSQQVEDGYYWFEIEGWKFSHCWVEIVGWTENVICQTGSYYIEKI